MHNSEETRILKGLGKYPTQPKILQLEELISNPQFLIEFKGTLLEAMGDPTEDIRKNAKAKIRRIGREGTEEGPLRGIKIILGYEKDNHLYILVKQTVEDKAYQIVHISQKLPEYKQIYSFEFKEE